MTDGRKSSSDKEGIRKKVKKPMTTKKKVIIGVAVAVVAACTAGGVWYEDQQARAEAQETATKSIKVTFNMSEDGKTCADTIEYAKGDNTKVETSTLVTAKADNKTKVSAKPTTVDSSKVGDSKVTYTVTTTDSYGATVSKDFKLTVTVQDTQKPVITTTADTASLTAGDTFDATTLITSVKDPVDGDIAKVDKLEDGKAGYTITSNVDANTAGSYEVSIDAQDANGNKADTKKVAVTVNAKAVETASTSNSGSSSSKSSSGSSKKSYSKSSGSSSGSSSSKSSSSSSSSSSSTGGSSSSGGSSKPAQSVCLSGQEAASQGADALWADGSTASNYEYADNDDDGCYIWWLTDNSASGGQD